MKNAAHKKLQHLGMGAAALAVLTGVSGCAYISPQATMDSYAPTDGIQMDLGDVQLRNILVVAEDENSEGRVLGTLINTGDQTDPGNCGSDGQRPMMCQCRCGTWMPKLARFTFTGWK